jgi:hypothetical protein
MFKQNNFWLGMAIGLALPLVLFGAIYFVHLLTGYISLEKALFVSVALNIVPIRYYFMTAKLEATARGLLAMTVVLIVPVTIAIA